MIVLPSGFEADLTPVFRDRAGNVVTQFDGDPTYSVSDPSMVELIVANDLTFITVQGKLAGDCQVSCSVDADLGDGVRNVTIVDTIHVVAGEAFTGGFTASELRPVV